MSWLSGWKYRKKLTITNSGTALTDYQLKFTINRYTGSDSGYTVYTVSKCLENYNDIRFTKSDGTTLLDYWIESSTSASAVIWVEIDSISASGNTDIYIYYGNSSASAVSNGDDTFPFFDDFNNGSTLDTGKWTKHIGSVSVGSSKVTFSSSTISGITSTAISGLGSEAHVIESKFNVISGTNTFNTGVSNAFTGNEPDGTKPDLQIVSTVVNTKFMFRDTGNTEFYTTTKDTENNIRIWTIKYIPSTFARADVYSENRGTIVKSSGNITSSLPTMTSFDRIHYISWNKQCELYWVLVRKYTATEPIISAWGSEELVLSIGGIIPIWTSLVFTDATIVPDHTTIEASYTYPNDYILIEWS
jgi:hypothetical protein